MSKQYMIYDTDGGGWKAQTFNVRAKQQFIIRSAGLTDTLPIYQMVGTCESCAPADVLWEPVTVCGEQLTVGPDNNCILIGKPGRYSIGDPLAPPVLAGDVNITGEQTSGVDTSSLGKCSDGGGSVVIEGPVTIDSSCDEPLFVELCSTSIGIETTMAELGCITDAEGVITGKVMVCKITDEATGDETIVMKAFLLDGTVIDDYTGEWSICSPAGCEEETVLGVITDLSLLAA